MRYLLAAAAALFAINFAAANTITPAVLAPGFSMALPGEWKGCGAYRQGADGDVRKLLCGLVQDERSTVSMLHDDGDASVVIGAQYDKDGSFPIDIVSVMTPDLTKMLDERLCGPDAKPMVSPPFRATRCHFEPLEVLTRRGLTGTVQAESTGSVTQEIDVRMIAVPYGGGAVLVMFAASRAAATRASKIVDAAVQSIAIDSATEPKVPAVHMVTVSPAPGVSITIPSNWVSCDAKTMAELSPPAGAVSVHLKYCNTPGNDWRASSPLLSQVLELRVQMREQGNFDAATLEAITPEQLKRLETSICSTATSGMAATGGKTESCAIEVETIHGRPVLIVTAVATPPNNPLGKFYFQIWRIPTKRGQLQTFAMTLNSEREQVEPLMAEIRKSISIDD